MARAWTSCNTTSGQSIASCFRIVEISPYCWIYTNRETALGMASLAVPIRVNGRVRYGLSTSAIITYDARRSSTNTCPTF